MGRLSTFGLRWFHMERRQSQRIPIEQIEDELLYLVSQGRTNREIATRLGRTPTAIKALLQRMYLRLWIPNRMALAAYARTRR